MVISPGILIEELMVVYSVLNVNICWAAFFEFDHFWGWQSERVVPFEGLEVPCETGVVVHVLESFYFSYPVLHVAIWLLNSPKTELIACHRFPVDLSFSQHIQVIPTHERVLGPVGMVLRICSQVSPLLSIVNQKSQVRSEPVDPVHSVLNVREVWVTLDI